MKTLRATPVRSEIVKTMLGINAERSSGLKTRLVIGRSFKMRLILITGVNKSSSSKVASWTKNQKNYA